jgi:hypothetical protein
MVLGLVMAVFLAIGSSALAAENLKQSGTSVSQSGNCPREVARHGVRASAFQNVFNDITSNNCELFWLDGYDVNGNTYFNAIFRPATGKAWVARHGLTSAQYQAEFDLRKRQGYHPRLVESYLSGNNIRYAVIFTKADGIRWTAYHGKTANQHQTLFDSLTSNGWRPVNVSVVSIGGQRSYTALYVKTNVGSYQLKSFLTPTQYQIAFDANNRAGRQLVYLNAYKHNGGVRFSAIWNSATNGAFVAKHGLTGAQYQAQWSTWTGQGFSTQVVTGYSVGNQHRFAALWRK